MQKMVLYHNNTYSGQLPTHWKKSKGKNIILGGIGALCLAAAFVNTIRLFDMNENDQMSESAVSHLNPTPIVLQEEIPIIDEELVETKSEVEQYIEYYCSIYQINKDIVYQKAKELTSDFSSPEWLYNNNVKGTRVIGQERSYDSQELGILAFVRHMKQIPTDFGFTKEELATNETYALDITYEEFTEKQCPLFHKFDLILCQAIQYHETDHYTSDVFFECNNPGGLIDSDTDYYWKFQNPAEGILELLVELEYKFCNISGFENLPIEEQIITMKKTYCPDKDKRDTLNLNQYWIDGVTKFYYQLSAEKQMSSNSK